MRQGRPEWKGWSTLDRRAAALDLMTDMIQMEDIAERLRHGRAATYGIARDLFTDCASLKRHVDEDH
jgi:hypothetical protein